VGEGFLASVNLREGWYKSPGAHRDTAPGSKVFLLLFRKTKEDSFFFSEEKKQKTFASARVRRYGTWPERYVRPEVPKPPLPLRRG
jgi:hypothetical protein